MGLQLPSELVSLLAMLGYDWPQADEEKLLQMGTGWTEFAGKMGQPLSDAQNRAQQVWTDHQGEGVEAFRATWSQQDAPVASLEDAGTAASIVGVGLMACAGIVLVLKINVIVQLVVLAIQIAQAIATAVVTFGASLAEIPIFKTITSIVIDELVGMALEAILNG